MSGPVDTDAELDATLAEQRKTDLEIKRLAGLGSIDYERARKESAEGLGVRASILDKLIKVQREEIAAKKAEGLCAETEPHGSPVDVAELLTEVRATISRFVVCSQETAIAATLWIAFTWVIDHVNIAPIAVITSPEKRCGKTQLLDLIGRLSKRALYASNISPAATFRVIEAKAPTLLIDEADSFFRENEELRGIINSGHTRATAYVIRTVGDDFEVKQFSTWAAKAIAGIGTLADTVMDRAVVLTLRRRLSGEKVGRPRHAEPGLFSTLASKLARFGVDHGDAIGRMRPELPEALNDRQQDNWEPLLSIADLASANWSKEARWAALAISGAKEDGSSTGEELLSDIRNLFDAGSADRLSMKVLLERLCDDELAPWSSWNRGKPMTARQLGKELAAYNIKGGTIHIDRYDKPWGFHRGQFEDTWGRYLAEDASSPEPPSGHSPTHSPCKSSQNPVSEPVSGAAQHAPHDGNSPPVSELNGEQTDFIRSPSPTPGNSNKINVGGRVSDPDPPSGERGRI